MNICYEKLKVGPALTINYIQTKIRYNSQFQNTKAILQNISSYTLQLYYIQKSVRVNSINYKSQKKTVSEIHIFIWQWDGTTHVTDTTD